MEQNSTRFEDEIDAGLIARAWRQETDPPGRRVLRYNTAAVAAFGWLYVDMFREWDRHRRGLAFAL